jgi:Outer membrane protein beta-barrel domain
MITMNSLAPRFAPTARRLVTAAAVLAGLAASASAQAGASEWLRPGSVYAAGSLGLLDTTYECGKGSPSCERPRIGGKVFGGYRMTPNLAAEIGFYYLGKFETAKDNTGIAFGDTTSRSSASLRNSAVSFGIDWSNEMFGFARQHIRFGLARVRTSGTEAIGVSGAAQSVTEYTTEPFLGLGLSYQFNPTVRFYSSYDTMRNKRNEHFHLFSLGLGIEN